MDPNINILEWSASPDAELIAADDWTRTATFRFTSPGEKTVKVRLDYPMTESIEMEYETKINIAERAQSDSFIVVDPPAYFGYGVTYTAMFINGSDPIFISDIKLPHNKYYMWINYQDWHHNQGSRTFTFSLPVQYKDVPIDYNMHIYYKTSQYSGETKMAVLKISNIR